MEINATMLIVCAVCLVVAVLLDNKWKVPLGMTCLLAAWIINFFALNLAPGKTLSYFPTNVVMPLILAMIYFSVFSSNGTSEIMAKKLMKLVNGNMKAYPWILFFVPFALYIVLDGPALRYILAPIIFSIAKAGKGSKLMAVSTAYLPFVAGGLNPFIGLDASTRVGIFADMGLSNSTIVGLATWLNSFVAILVCQIIIYIATKSWKVPSIEMETSGGDVRLNEEQKKSIILLVVTIILFVVPPLLKMIFPKSMFAIKLATIFCNYTIFVLGILAVVVFKLGDWRQMANKASMRQLLMITGVTFLIKTAQAFGLQEVCTNVAKAVPSILIAPILLIICAVLSFFVAAPTVQPMLFPMAAAMAQTPTQAITYLSCVALGLAASGVSPISSSGAALLSTVEDSERDEYSSTMFKMAFIGPVIMAIVALVGGMSIFSALFAGQYF